MQCKRASRVESDWPIDGKLNQGPGQKFLVSFYQNPLTADI